MIVHLMIPHPHCFVNRAIIHMGFVTAFGFDLSWVCSSIIISSSARDDHDIISCMAILIFLLHIFDARQYP